MRQSRINARKFFLFFCFSHLLVLFHAFPFSSLLYRLFVDNFTPTDQLFCSFQERLKIVRQVMLAWKTFTKTFFTKQFPDLSLPFPIKYIMFYLARTVMFHQFGIYVTVNMYNQVII